MLQRYRDLKILDLILYASRVELCESPWVDYHTLVKKGSSFNFPIKKTGLPPEAASRKIAEVIFVVTEFIRKRFSSPRNISGNNFRCHRIYPEIISVVTEFIRKLFLLSRNLSGNNFRRHGMYPEKI